MKVSSCPVVQPRTTSSSLFDIGDADEEKLSFDNVLVLPRVPRTLVVAHKVSTPGRPQANHSLHFIRTVSSLHSIFQISYPFSDNRPIQRLGI